MGNGSSLASTKVSEQGNNFLTKSKQRCEMANKIEKIDGETGETSSNYYMALEKCEIKWTELGEEFTVADVVIIKGKILIAKELQDQEQNETIIEIDLTTNFPDISIENEGEHWNLVILQTNKMLVIKSNDEDQAKTWLNVINFQTVMFGNEEQDILKLQSGIDPEVGRTSMKEQSSHEPKRKQYVESDYLLPPTYTGITSPKMNIVILVVGTKGDAQPFIYFAQNLQKDGHRVRVATHAEYRDDVVKKGGLEYYPLAGDPRRLSEFMVKTKGRLVPDLLSKEERAELPEKLKMLKEICYSCWPAVSEPDPEDPEKKPFIADAIISNPVTYGHIHCAQKLGVPLHIMFPQPWYPTMCFPHPLMNLKLVSDWSSKNFFSYGAFNDLMHIATGTMVNQFRREVLGLPSIYRGLRITHNFANLLVRDNVPIGHMWSPSFVPKCPDWPKHVDVVGEFRNMTVTASTAYKPSDKLQSFVSTGEKPIYIGFGSMVIDDATKLVSIIKESAASTKCRVLLQSGWTKYADDETMISDEVMVIGAMPHDYLFTTVAGVIHHGGAGTTSAGLRAGNPTFICPFFGDQHFWAEMVYRSGAGPKGCPINKLTVDKLSNAFIFMRDANTITKAKELGAKMSAEDGCAAGVNSFYRNLPLNKLLCDVSIFDNRKSRLATVWCTECGLKMCHEVDTFVHRSESDRHNHIREKYFSLWDDYTSDRNSFTTPVKPPLPPEPEADEPRDSFSMTAMNTAVNAAKAISHPKILVKNVVKGTTNAVRETFQDTKDIVTETANNVMTSITLSTTKKINKRRSTYVYDMPLPSTPLSSEQIALEISFKQALSLAKLWDNLDIDRDTKLMDDKLFASFLLTEQQTKAIEIGWKDHYSASGIGFNELGYLISKTS